MAPPGGGLVRLVNDYRKQIWWASLSPHLLGYWQFICCYIWISLLDLKAWPAYVYFLAAVQRLKFPRRESVLVVCVLIFAGGQSQAPFTQPFQGRTVMPLLCLTGLYKHYRGGMWGQCCSAS